AIRRARINNSTSPHWLSLPLSLLFLLAVGANATLLTTICMETSLHQPLYYLLSLLSLLDIVLCLTIIPKVLAIFWFDLRSISFPACFLQMFILNSFLTMESCTFIIMAYDRYVAICKPLQYSFIITDQFVARAAIFVVVRNGLLTMPIPILSSRLRYCNCICTNVSVFKLSCDYINLNRRYQFVTCWTLLGSDLILIAEGAMAKALSMCASHFILILFFSTVLLVLVITNLARKTIPVDSILLNILHRLIPPALNPTVYGMRMNQNLLRRL
uniref:G-protein coupled receptors family 1 profile domain-containing protein n=1 Tax=Colobus angolensis palliatus TaxID=336983 RepID=A0A2K5HVE6_COLAP